MAEPKKIMIVDDEPDTITFLGTWLADRGYRTCSAADGEEGLRVLVAERPDLVLLDLNMPNQTGMQLYRKLRADAALAATPVIFITGMTEIEIFGNGCTPMPQPAARIEKPVDLVALAAAIERALG